MNYVGKQELTAFFIVPWIRSSFGGLIVTMRLLQSEHHDTRFVKGDKDTDVNMMFISHLMVILNTVFSCSVHVFLPDSVHYYC